MRAARECGFLDSESDRSSQRPRGAPSAPWLTAHARCRLSAAGVLFGKANAWVPGGAAPAAEAGAAAEAKEPVSSKPFVPSAIPKTGYNRTLEKFPPYVPDPLDVKLAAEREKKRKDKEAQPPKAFVPSNTPKTQATKSIVRMNLGR